MTVPVEVRLVAPHAERQYDRAPQVVREALGRLAAAWRRQPLGATFIRLRRIPAATRKRWESRVGGIGPIFKDDLPLGWRVIYTVVSDRSSRVVLVLEVVSHTKYDRLLGYG